MCHHRYSQPRVGQGGGSYYYLLLIFCQSKNSECFPEPALKSQRTFRDE